MPTLEFKGKQHIYAHHLTVPYRPLEPDPARSLNPAGVDDNLIIHGDNLHALKALLPRYAGRVKCIYIDPPYNTGNEGWVYNDKVNSPLMKAWLKENGPVDGEDLERHDKWLCMMWPRLHLLKELLSDDGIIFISIDDNEHPHLRMVMDEIFGSENFISDIAWWSKYTLSNDARMVSSQHENILFYAKDATQFEIGLLPRTKDMDKAYKNPDADPRGPWKATPLHARSGKDSDRYSITFPNGITWQCPAGRYPSYKKSHLLQLYESKELYFGKNGKSQPNRKTFLSEVKQGKTVGSLWAYQEIGSTHQSNEEVASIFGKGVFPNAKGTKLLDRMLKVANVGLEDTVLDSFAGSGTTAHAVLALNKEDGGNRKFILVECEDYADSITAERVRRVIKGVPDSRDKSLKEGLGGSFTYCELGEPIDIEGMLKGNSLPSFQSLASLLLHTASGISAGEADLTPKNDDGLFYSTDATAYYMLYKPDKEWLSSNQAVLNEDKAKRVSEECKQDGKKAIFFAPAKYIGQRELTSMGITFCQLPYELHRVSQATAPA